MLSEIEIHWMARKYSDLNLWVFVFLCVLCVVCLCVYVCMCVCMCVCVLRLFRIFLHGV